MDMKDQRRYGLYLERHNRHGTEHVTVRVVSREADQSHPLGVGSSYNWPKGLHLDALVMDGFASEVNLDPGGSPSFIGDRPEYREPFTIGLSDAKRMVHTLKAIWRRIEKDQAREPGDILYSMCKALKLSFVCVATTKNYGSAWADQDYRWLTIAEGRNEYRRMIAEAIDDTRKKIKPAA